MKTYVDANTLVRLYLNLPGKKEVLAFVTGTSARGATPLPVSDLLSFEVRNALERMVFESRTSGQWRVTPEAASVAQADFAATLQAGVFLRRVPLALTDIEKEFESLVARHTAKNGFRTYDVMHVASAITLRCKRFLSFDTKANALAKLAGLQTGL